MVLLDGFYLVVKDGKFYGKNKEFVDEAKDAYAFILPHCAESLANRVGGKMVRK